MKKTITTLTVVGRRPIPERIIDLLRETGQVTISAKETVEIVHPPSPVKASDKLYKHRRDAFWTTLFRKFLEEGFTLFYDEKARIWIRITPRFTYIFTLTGEDDGNYAKLATPVFLREYNRGNVLKTSIWSLLASEDDVFDELEGQVTLSEAFERMNWDGSEPPSGDKPAAHRMGITPEESISQFMEES